MTTNTLVNSNKFQDDYQLTDRLGDGGYATVFLGRSKQNPKVRVAVKKLSKQRNGHTPESLTARYKQEAQMLSQSEHPNILKYITCYDEADAFYLVTEYVEGDDLFTQINNQQRIFSEQQLRKLLKSLLKAIKHLHDHNIVHRDLKLENILTCAHPDQPTKEILKLIDFGFAAEAQGFNLSGGMGTIYYAAPEVFQRELYGKPIDMWSFGVVTYCLLYGRYPFFSENKVELTQQVLNARFLMRPMNRAKELVSKELKDFVSRLLVVDPLKRMTVDEALNHPWMKLSPISFTTATYVIQAVKKLKKLAEQSKLKRLAEQQQQQLAQIAAELMKQEPSAVARKTTQSVESVLSSSEISIGQAPIVPASSSLLLPSPKASQTQLLRRKEELLTGEDVSSGDVGFEVETRLSRVLWFHTKRFMTTLFA